MTASEQRAENKNRAPSQTRNKCWLASSEARSLARLPAYLPALTQSDCKNRRQPTRKVVTWTRRKSEKKASSSFPPSLPSASPGARSVNCASVSGRLLPTHRRNSPVKPEALSPRHSLPALTTPLPSFLPFLPSFPLLVPHYSSDRAAALFLPFHIQHFSLSIPSLPASLSILLVPPAPGPFAFTAFLLHRAPCAAQRSCTQLPRSARLLCPAPTLFRALGPRLRPGGPVQLSAARGVARARLARLGAINARGARRRFGTRPPDGPGLFPRRPPIGGGHVGWLCRTLCSLATDVVRPQPVELRRSAALRRGSEVLAWLEPAA